MTMTHVWAVCKKQNKDTMRNKALFLQFLIHPVMALILENAIDMEGMPKNYFTILFAIMFLGMAPMTAMATVLSEEKEKNTLRMLKMAGVSSVEYMLGAGGYLFGICFLGAVIFGMIGRLTGEKLLPFLVAMTIGIIISMLLGAVIGIWSKNQTAATSVTVPIMMVFSFLPMISMFNQTVEKVARFSYTWQIQQFLYQMPEQSVSGEAVLVLGGNLLIVVILFGIAYRKYGL